MALGGLVHSASTLVKDSVKAVRGSEKSLKAEKNAAKVAEKESKTGVTASEHAAEKDAGNATSDAGKTESTGTEGGIKDGSAGADAQTQSDKELSATANNEDPNKTQAPVNEGDQKTAEAVARNNEAQKTLKTKDVQKQATRAEYRALHPRMATSYDFAKAMGNKIAHSKGARYALGFEGLAMMTGNGMMPFHVLKDAFHVMGYGMDKADQVATGKTPMPSVKQSAHGTQTQSHADGQVQENEDGGDGGFIDQAINSSADKMMDANGFSNTTSEMSNQVTTGTSDYGKNPDQEYTNDGPEV